MLATVQHNRFKQPTSSNQVSVMVCPTSKVLQQKIIRHVSNDYLNPVHV